MRLFQVALRAAAAGRPLSTGAVRSAGGKYPNDPGYKTIQKLQSAWAVDDGKLVWQKRGSRDQVPYLLTMGLTLAGVLCSVVLIGVMSFPQKKQE